MLVVAVAYIWKFNQVHRAHRGAQSQVEQAGVYRVCIGLKQLLDFVVADEEVGLALPAFLVKYSDVVRIYLAFCLKLHIAKHTFAAKICLLCFQLYFNIAEVAMGVEPSEIYQEDLGVLEDGLRRRA